MNFVIPDKTMPHGLALLEPKHAKAAAAWLRDRLPHADEAAQAGRLASIRDLERAATPEIHFYTDLYTPAWYVPGWEANT